ncbi:macrophage mannose receptor 1 [Lepeophtheirus salmonis]|uniref:macrophage mannose receptor 1 n=1 Tax=Lepeophtheirus salmonis TaxID=72036 RepID=UPI003AF3DD9B
MLRNHITTVLILLLLFDWRGESKLLCRNGWTKIGGYKCIKMMETKQSWTNANQHCILEGGQLLSLDYLTDTTKLAHNGTIHVGPGIDAKAESSNTLLMPVKSNSMEFGGSCLEWVSEMDLIRDIDCNDVPNSFTCIIEESQETRQQDAVKCNDGWIETHNQCFFFSTEEVSKYEEAELKCKKLESTLAIIRNEYVNDIVKNQIGGTAYIGLIANKPKLYFEWADGAVLGHGDFTSWDTNYPVKNDTILWVEIDKNGKWRNVGFEEKKFYACSKYKINCPNGFLLFQNQCYYVSTDSRNIDEAEKDCESRGVGGAYLANIPNKEINDFIAKQLKGQITFFGLTYNGEKFVWSDGGDIKENDFVNWSEGMPKPNLGACTAFDENKNWISTPCGVSQKYVCEIAPHEPPSHHCNFDDNMNWLENPYNGRCYLIMNRRRNFQEADAECNVHSEQNNQARLLSIHDPTEQQFITSAFLNLGHRGSYWIGFNSEMDFYQWTDSSPFSYSNFVSNDVSKTCLKLPLRNVYGHWVDADCNNEKLPSICSKKGKHYKGPPPIPDANNCPEGWLRSGHQCLFFSSIKENYNNARASCKAKKSTLAYILDERTNYFIQGQINDGSGDAYYFGLNDIQTQHQYVWPDGTILSGYSNWAPNEPNDNHHAQNCVEMFMDGYWNDRSCDGERKYICATQYNVCPAHWHSTNTRCFYTSDNDWDYEEAQKECTNKNSYLASIHDEHENQFIASTLQHPSQSYWLGLRKEKLHSEYDKWLDGSEIDYTNFAQKIMELPNEDNSSTFYGVHMNQQGLWRPSESTTKSQFVCSAKQTHFITCPPGWKKSPSSCYILIKLEKTFHKASRECKDRGGYLARIESIEEEDFLISYIFDEKKALGIEHVWIGLKTKKKRNHYYTWEDGSDLRFSNWERKYPIQSEDISCVWLNEKLERFWTNVKCSSQSAYICEKPQTITENPPPEERGCTHEQVPYQGNCYEIFLTQRTFDEAIHACAEKQGSLLKIKNMENQAMLISIIHNTKGDFFLGLKYDANTSTWTWLDDTSLNGYSNWGDEEPQIGDINPLNVCAIMTSQSLYTGVWKTAKCNDQHDFICQSPRKGFTNPPEPTTPHTTIDPTFKCPENYVFIDSLCYYFSPYRRHTFEGAEKECSLMRGHLVSFKDYEHEDRVSEEILSFFEDQAYIGLREFPQLGGFHWLDPSFPYGSYTNWDDGQPNSYGGSQACVSVQKKKWTMTNCMNELPFICATTPSADPFPTLPPDPTVNPKLPCEGMDNSWFMLPNQIESYCYKFSRFEETWHTSLRQCRDEGSELVSIHNTEQNNILWHILQHLAIKEWFVWMGVNGLNENEEYRWTDGTPMNFVNWKGDDSGEHSSMKSCGEMLIREGGLWQKSHCGIKRRFICKKPQHGSFPSPAPPIIPRGHCKVGLPEYLGYCYSISVQEFNWSDARKNCLSSKSDLVSVHSIKEMSFLTSRVLPLLNTSLSWIGYQDLIHETNFGWSDESPVDYTNWAGNEPVSGFSINNDCVGAYTRDPHKIGKWANIKNDTMLNFICKTKAQPSVTEMTYKLPKCNENEEFDEYDGNCYLYVKEQKSWSEAKNYCRSKKSNLVSVQTLQENSFLTAYLENDSWIGLYFTKENKEVQWTDGSEYIYESFELDEMLDPNILNCVSLNSETGKWNINIHCDNYAKKSFWCSIKQKREPTPDLVGEMPRDSWMG